MSLELGIWRRRKEDEEKISLVAMKNTYHLGRLSNKYLL
jgi:hypothetical protein